MKRPKKISVRVMLCINSEANGMCIDRLRAFEIEDPIDHDTLITVHGPYPDRACPVFRHVKVNQIQIGRRRYKTHGYRNWVGNWCWDCAILSIEDAVDVLNMLHARGDFHCEEARSDFYDQWNGGGKFTGADVLNGDKPHWSPQDALTALGLTR
jgi:hypothetical protein